ncbi:tRNA dihydrouridine synthase B [Salmonella enterica subsp. enterica serovar Wandsworth str. A4-580]|uniref:tRNA dihydrouridine synthase B n=1 Tax=Salmonella enterica subsp. enterica serovar Wandsworth str. A4-580 TaxID=913086 RepID=G5S5Z5_SALET|nr:tRNA dihydrouridine synthase B [Salmonella enterica subsp. enterica serovar Wandsworth str. A4-580]
MSSNPQVWESDKSRLRMVHVDEPGIRTVQIAGSDPVEMADAARINVESGAQIIDIWKAAPRLLIYQYGVPGEESES